jgi:hypothetical protein
VFDLVRRVLGGTPAQDIEIFRDPPDNDPQLIGRKRHFTLRARLPVVDRSPTRRVGRDGVILDGISGLCAATQNQ